jgi:quercetin dioxygenase-like cupin family protein
MLETPHYIKDLASLVDSFPPDSILSRNIYQDESVKIILFGFQPEQELSEHTASVPATLHFLRGSATVSLGDDTKSAREGTWIHLPAHLSHSVKAETETMMLLTLLL